MWFDERVTLSIVDGRTGMVWFGLGDGFVMMRVGFDGSGGEL